MGNGLRIHTWEGLALAGNPVSDEHRWSSSAGNKEPQSAYPRRKSSLGRGRRCCAHASHTKCTGSERRPVDFLSCPQTSGLLLWRLRKHPHCFSEGVEEQSQSELGWSVSCLKIEKRHVLGRWHSLMGLRIPTFYFINVANVKMGLLSLLQRCLKKWTTEILWHQWEAPPAASTATSLMLRIRLQCLLGIHVLLY